MDSVWMEPVQPPSLAGVKPPMRYEITGDDPPWRPVRAFDDGSKIYIQFPEHSDQGEAPPLFVVGLDGGSRHHMHQHSSHIDRDQCLPFLVRGVTPYQYAKKLKCPLIYCYFVSGCRDD